MRFLILTEQAQRKSDFKTLLQNHHYQIVDNLIRLYCWSDSDLKSHWTTELYAQLHSCPVLKSNKKYPSSDFIYEYIYGEMEDSLTYKSLMNTIQSDSYIENKDIPYFIYTDTNLDNLRNYLSDYCRWISDELSSSGSVSVQDIQIKTESLINIYTNL